MYCIQRSGETHVPAGELFVALVFSYFFSLAVNSMVAIYLNYRDPSARFSLNITDYASIMYALLSSLVVMVTTGGIIILLIYDLIQLCVFHR